MRWAARELYVQNWTLELVLDGKIEKHPRFDRDDVVEGQVVFVVGDLLAVLGIHRDMCREKHEDPIFTLFHEIAHVATSWATIVDKPGRFGRLWDQNANRFAQLLWRLYPHK